MSLMGTSSILDGCPKKSFSLVYDLGKRFFGRPSRINDAPIKLTQFCYNTPMGLVQYKGIVSLILPPLCFLY